MKDTALRILLLCLFPTFLMAQQNGHKHQALIQKQSQYQPLIDAAKNSNTDALIVIENGKKVVEYFQNSEEEKIESMSITKSVVALAIARLLTENKIDSLNTPVAHYYPEWRQGQKKNITIRHLMNHTSGLQNARSTRIEIQPSPDFIQLALCASVVDKPGSKFSYNNKAVNLLSGIVRKAANKQMDEYLKETIFSEMGITDFDWRTDDVGNLRAMAGFQVRPNDLAKLGQLVLHKGSWNGKQLIDQKWIDELLAQSQPHRKTGGLLWWRVPASTKHVIDNKQIHKMEQAGLAKTLLEKMKKIKGEYESQGAAVQALMGQFNRREVGQIKRQLAGKMDPWRTSKCKSIVGYEAKGYLGQYLVIYPEENIVALRMVKQTRGYRRKTDLFGNFSRMVYKLATEKSS